MAPHVPPRLLAHIGATSARFALESAPGRRSATALLRCADHADFQAAVRAYLATLPPGTAPAHAAVAIASPVDGDQVRMPTHRWDFSIEDMRQRLQLDTLLVVNDCTALAMALPRLDSQATHQVGGGLAVAGGVIGLLAPGAGLGMAGLVPAGDGWMALGSGGGHTSVAPRDEREIVVLRHAWRQFGRVSFDHLLSGPGLALIHQALAAHAGAPAEPLAAPEITRRALAGTCPVCQDTVEVFCAMLGTAAADLAVTLGACGGIYIGGGIVPRLGAAFDRSPFRQRFEDGGGASRATAAIPTHVVTAEHAALVGASAMLAARLQALKAAPGSAILLQIRRACSALSPAELRVAGHVLAHPRAVLSQPIVEIAKAAQVSQPTVIRFCRSLGCEGLSDFKLRLASDLTGTVPIAPVQVADDDSSVELGSKVLGNTASAILQMRSQLNSDMIDRSIALLAQANRVEFHSAGQDGCVAIDAQFKFLRLGIPSAAHTDPRLQTLAAGVLQPGDVAVLISSGGRLPDLLEVADLARARGAAVVAITASQSPLARKADAVLAVDHVEDAGTQVPMVGRILQLLVVDILTVGLARRRPMPDAVPAGTATAASAAPVAAPRAAAPAPGSVAAAPLSRLTLHSR